MKYILLLCFLSALPHHMLADAIDNFTLTGGSQVLTFSLAASPAGVNEGDDFYVTDLNFTLGSTKSTAAEVAFYDTAVGGGLAFADQSGNILDNLAFTGDQVFGGSTSTPSFAPGTFNLASYFDGTMIYSLSIAPASGSTPTSVTPEPSSLLLLGTGILALFGFAQLRPFPHEAECSRAS